MWALTSVCHSLTLPLAFIIPWVLGLSEDGQVSLTSGPDVGPALCKSHMTFPVLELSALRLVLRSGWIWQQEHLTVSIPSSIVYTSGRLCGVPCPTALHNVLVGKLRTKYVQHLTQRICVYMIPDQSCYLALCFSIVTFQRHTVLYLLG